MVRDSIPVPCVRVEGWRLIAGALLAMSGIVLMLLVMAKARERQGRAADAAIAGAVSFVVVAILVLLVLLVLPALVVWSLVVLVGATVTVMMLAS
jgi:hypothetical protein